MGKPVIEEHHVTFGEYLRNIRQNRKVSQRQLAEKVNISFTYISHIEHGHMIPPSAKVCMLMAQVLDVPPHEMLFHAGKMKPYLDAIKCNPLAMELIWIMSQQPLSDETYRQMIALAKQESK